MDKFYKKLDTTVDINIFKDIIVSNVDFKSPFDDKNSVLNSYSYSNKSKEQNHCGVQFHYLQKCDYENGVKDRMSEIYIKSMMRNNRKQNLMDEYKMLEDNYDKLVQKTPGTIIKFKLVNLAVAENAFQDYVRKF